MSDAAETSDINVPLFLSDAIAEVQRLTNFGRMTDLGFTLGGSLPGLLQILRDRLDGVDSVAPTLDWLQGLADELQPYAKQETDSDMAYLKSLLTVRYVTILETAVQDAVAYSLEHVPAVFKNEIVRKIHGPVVEMLAASPAERAEFLANALAQETKSALRVGVGRFEALLEPVGLAGAVDSDARRAILELLQVRNVLVHKNGRADGRLVKQCPWLKAVPGTEVKITSQMTSRYRFALIYYLCELSVRWLQRSSQTADIGPLVQIRQNALERLHGVAGEAG